MNKQVKLLLTLFLLSALLIACKDDETIVETPVAEKAAFTVTVENISGSYDFIHCGAFNTPVGATSPGPLLPGNSYQFDFTAAPGMKLSFATMFVHSNDFFYAPGEEGITLYDGSNNQITGDITSQIMLWDSGTEVNQEPGLGTDQAPRQTAANSGGIDPNNIVRLAPDDFGNLPAVADVIKVTLLSTSSTGFRLTIENVSSASTLSTSDGAAHAVPMAPGVFVIHSNSKPLFAAGQADYGMGLMNVAEDGDPTALLTSVNAKTGLTSLFAPEYLQSIPLITLYLQKTKLI